MRLVRTYSYPKVSILSDVADGVFDLEPVQDVASWNGTQLEWLSGSQVVQKLVVLPSDDLLALVHTAARTFGCLAIAGHETQTLGRAVADDEVWYGRNPTPPVATVVTQEPDGSKTVEAEIDSPAARWVLLAAPLIIMSFAWVPFIFTGGLKEMGKQFWAMAVTGSSQKLAVHLGDDLVTVNYSHSGEDERVESVPRAGLLAFSRGSADTGALQLIAIYSDRTLRLPSLVKHKNDREKLAHCDLVAQLNLAIGSY